MGRSSTLHRRLTNATLCNRIQNLISGIDSLIAVVIWLKYCRSGVKHYIHQLINH